MTRDNTTQIIRDTFFDLSLCLEAIFLIHKADGELVEAIMRNMEEIYENATRTMEQGKEHRYYPSVERGRIWKKQVKDKRFSAENEKAMNNEAYLM